MKLTKKGLIIALCSVVAVVGITAGAFIAASNKSVNKSSHTVKFDLCTDLKTTTVLDRTVEHGAFLVEPEVYVTEANEENWAISGWYTEPEYEIEWDFDFDTVESDITLYAKWAANPECTVSFYTKESSEPVYITTIKEGLKVSKCDDEFMGREVLGYFADAEMTQEFDFGQKILTDTSIWVKISDYVYFDAKTIDKWNICGNLTEVSDYEVSTSLSSDETILTVSTKNGGYFWLKNLNLAMNGTSIIEVKMREVNDDYSGALGGYILGSYTINQEPGASSDFGQPNTGSMQFGRSAEPDEDGFYTYTYNIGNIAPGLVYDTMTGIRIGFAGTVKNTYEIKSIKTYVDKYAVSGEAFTAKGIDYSALHLNTFTLMVGAKTEMLDNGNLRFAGENGAFIFKKNLENRLGDEQIIRLKAKGDLKGGMIALFFFGDYTLNGTKGTLTDYTAEHRVNFVAESTDADGYTIYAADISSIPGLKYNVIRGLRIDLYGEGSRSIDIQWLKSYAPTAEETALKEGFFTNKLNLKGGHFQSFLVMGDANTKYLNSGDFRFGGENGVFLYKKNVEISLGKQQQIQLKAKGDLKGGKIRLYLFGEYTQDGKKGTSTDYSDLHHWDFIAGETDAKGYTTYTIDINSTPGLKWNVIHGLRIDLYGEGTRTIDIKSLKGIVPSKEEEKLNDDFTSKGLNLTGSHFTKFMLMGDVTTKLLDNGDFLFGGGNGVFLYKKETGITLGKQQTIELKAKGDLKGGKIRLYLFGEYTLNGKKATSTDYTDEFKWDFVAGETDADGYTTYSIEIGSIKGLVFNKIHGLRLDLYGEDTRTIYIKSLKSVIPSTEDVAVNDAFTAQGLDFTGTHFVKFNQQNDVVTTLLDNGDFRLNGKNGSAIYKKGLEISLGDEQRIELKAKSDLQGGAINVYLYGEYTLNGEAKVSTDYNAQHNWRLVEGTTDADGYTTYTLDIGSKAGLQYQTIHGIRVEVVGSSDNMTLQIVAMNSVKAPESGNNGNAGGDAGGPVALNLDANALSTFLPALGATSSLTGDALHVSGVHGSCILGQGLNYLAPASQKMELKLKVSDVQRVDVWVMGTYKQNGETKTAATELIKWYLYPTSEYGTYTIDLTTPINNGYTDLEWQTITGLRIDVLQNDSSLTPEMDIQYVKAVEE